MTEKVAADSNLKPQISLPPKAWANEKQFRNLKHISKTKSLGTHLYHKGMHAFIWIRVWGRRYANDSKEEETKFSMTVEALPAPKSALRTIQRFWNYLTCIILT